MKDGAKMSDKYKSIKDSNRGQDVYSYRIWGSCIFEHSLMEHFNSFPLFIPTKTTKYRRNSASSQRKQWTIKLI